MSAHVEPYGKTATRVNGEQPLLDAVIDGNRVKVFVDGTIETDEKKGQVGGYQLRFPASGKKLFLPFDKVTFLQSKYTF